jgi:hypothetical protein
MNSRWTTVPDNCPILFLASNHGGNESRATTMASDAPVAWARGVGDLCRPIL